VVTGGGPGIMEAGNRGAADVGAKSLGFNITLPHEQVPNPYITPELCFQFHYFALRKLHFILRAKALVVFPGGFGTLDELFDALTLRQTRRMQEIPRDLRQRPGPHPIRRIAARSLGCDSDVSRRRRRNDRVNTTRIVYHTSRCRILPTMLDRLPQPVRRSHAMPRMVYSMSTRITRETKTRTPDKILHQNSKVA
jgi:hypothetical protein